MIAKILVTNNIKDDQIKINKQPPPSKKNPKNQNKEILNIKTK